MAQTLILRHTGECRFRVERQSDGKASPAVELQAPDAVAVPGRPDSHLLRNLGWYLEKFLDYPFPPNTELADRIQDALTAWGEDCFARLFAGQALIWYHEARQAGLDRLTLKIASDDPRILGWPWEALRDPDGTTLAHSCRIERQVSALHDPLPLPEGLPTDRINILLVIARPYGDKDVGYHALARPLVERVSACGLPVRIEVLRPPTFEQLQRHLHRRPGFYHILHFDGHGGYGEAAYGGNGDCFRGVEGRLIFETRDGADEAVSADKLAPLLSDYRIPIMVLNACQSARIDERADDPFASVAAALLKAGIRSVVAMGYNLYVSAAQQFVPAFYDRLIESGEVAEATRAGRRAMLAQDARVCARGTYPLRDWLVPVLYQQEALVLPVAELRSAPERVERLPEEARKLGDYGFIGRQRAIQALERAVLTQPQAVLLIHGMAGVGKSTLVMGYLRWLEQTQGLGDPEEGTPFAGILWLGFEDIRSAEFVVNALVEPLFGHAATAAPLDQKLPALTQALRDTPLLIVWDNFESAAGIPGTEVTPQLPETDRQQLGTLIQGLRGGKSRLLLTSRSRESWLATTAVYRLPLGGLQGEERWEYCNAVVADLGLRPKREDAHYGALMDALDGHPLAMRAVLLRLGETSAETLLAELEAAFSGSEGDESTRRIFAALALLDAGLPDAFAPLLQLIGLHRRYVHVASLEQIAEGAGTPVTRETLNPCLAALETGGLLHHEGQGIYLMHPALSGFLADRHPATEAAQRGFVDFMGGYADQLAPKQLHEQRGHFAIHGVSFHQALGLASELGMQTHVLALTQSLATFAQNRRDLAAARQLFEALATESEKADDQDGLAGAYHQLGMIAEEQRDFASAEAWYRKALAILDQQGNAHGTASSHHQLGMIAEEQRDFASAEAWYKKSLAILEQQGDAHGAAASYHHLGVIAQKQRDFASAEAWYKKSLAILEQQGDAHGAASSHHQLGTIAQEQRDFASAEAWYKKSLAIKEQQGNAHGAALSYHQLGRIAEEQRDFASAEAWYRKSLAIFEQQGNAHGAALSYHQLGRIAEEQRDFASAEAWYRKSLAIEEQQGNAHGAASSYHQLGIVAQKQRDFASAEAWYRKSLAIKEQQGNAHGAATSYHQLGIVAQKQRDFTSAEAWYRKSLGIFEQQGNAHGAALSYHQLGIIAQEQRDFASAEAWYRKALAIKEQQGNAHGAASSYGQLGSLALEQRDFASAGAWFLKAIERFAQSNDSHYLGIAVRDFARTLQAADAPVQTALRQDWQEAGLDQLITLEDLERQLREQKPND
ncbi:tetratricopeptide repeat protein [Rhabdochromatium marinum]|uniref:tetratricopeptide repeat protein n=1 Tax=Rhabdochromatium marinum TaxID=48729 RepID=UPI001906B0CB|nr:tetratricopeptide repeat protein [Rhabdochromatium marinum]MBK1648393.1 hypothetical protein [Rhabdochromatium marinum]